MMEKNRYIHIPKQKTLHPNVVGRALHQMNCAMQKQVQETYFIEINVEIDSSRSFSINVFVFPYISIETIKSTKWSIV